MRPNIYLYQIYFRSSQREHIEPAFIPFNNSRNPKPEWHEYQTFLSEHEKGAWDESSYYGYVSWKFGMKTGVSGRSFLDFIQLNPGADVYFINPFHEYALTFKNVWSQGEYFHPGMTALAADVFREIGLDIDVKGMINGEWDTAFCNYWVARPSFWRRYLPYIRAILDLADCIDRTSSLAERLNAPVPRHVSATYLTFVLERIFTSFVHRERIDARAYPFSDEWFRARYGVLHDHLVPLREMKRREVENCLSAAERSVLDAYRRLFMQYKEVEFAHQTLNSPLVRNVSRLTSHLPAWAGGRRL
jgi:hypothetical protein